MTEWNPNQGELAVSQYLQQVKVGNMESKCKYENGKAHLNLTPHNLLVSYQSEEYVIWIGSHRFFMSWDIPL